MLDHPIGSPRRRAAAALLSLAVLSGCASSLKLRAQFDDEPVGLMPSTTPNPTPPADSFFWSNQRVSSRIVSVGPTNRSVSSQPHTGFFSQSSPHAFVGVGTSEALTGRPVRGGVRVKLTGVGIVIVDVMGTKPGTKAYPLAAFKLQIYEFNPRLYVSTVTSSAMTTIINQPSYADDFGTALTTTTAGTEVELRWAVDPAARSINMGAYPAGGNGATLTEQFEVTFPLETLRIDVSFYQPQQNATLLLDDFVVEEL